MSCCAPLESISVTESSQNSLGIFRVTILFLLMTYPLFIGILSWRTDSNKVRHFYFCFPQTPLLVITLAQKIHSFSSSNQLDLNMLRYLIKSMSHLLDPEDNARVEHEGDDLKILSSKPAGCDYLLKVLWDRLNIDNFLKNTLTKRYFSAPIAEALFAIVANQSLTPSFKLAIEQ